MATIVKTYPFTANAEGWVFTSGSKATGVWQSPGEWLIQSVGRNNLDTSYIELTTTWEALGIPVGATINQITANSISWSCTEMTVSDGYGIGQFEVLDSLSVLQATLFAQQSGSTLTSFATKTGTASVAIPSAIQTSGTTVKFRLSILLDNGNNASAVTSVKYDNVSFTVDYTEAPLGTPIKINVSDAWSIMIGSKINVGDAWKTVVSVKQNIGDVWKNVY